MTKDKDVRHWNFFPASESKEKSQIHGVWPNAPLPPPLEGQEVFGPLRGGGEDFATKRYWETFILNLNKGQEKQQTPNYRWDRNQTKANENNKWEGQTSPEVLLKDGEMASSQKSMPSIAMVVGIPGSKNFASNNC